MGSGSASLIPTFYHLFRLRAFRDTNRVNGVSYSPSFVTSAQHGPPKIWYESQNPLNQLLPNNCGFPNKQNYNGIFQIFKIFPHIPNILRKNEENASSISFHTLSGSVSQHPRFIYIHFDLWFYFRRWDSPVKVRAIVERSNKNCWNTRFETIGYYCKN